MNDIPRYVTEREVFNKEYLIRWKACKEMAKEELDEDPLVDGKHYTYADLLSATAQLFIPWNHNAGYIKNLQQKKQEELDKRLAATIAKGVR